MQITVQYNQTLADIAIQGSGALDTLFALAQANGFGITDSVVAGQALAGIAPEPGKSYVAIRLQQADNLPASGDLNTEGAIPGGIGFMQIGNDFVVSPP